MLQYVMRKPHRAVGRSQNNHDILQKALCKLLSIYTDLAGTVHTNPSIKSNQILDE